MTWESKRNATRPDFKAREYYREGYRAGRLDGLMGLYLQTGANSTLPGYAVGYRDGQNDAKNEKGDA